jgi:hypothetical protein
MYCWLVADKPSEQGDRLTSNIFVALWLMARIMTYPVGAVKSVRDSHAYEKVIMVFVNCDAFTA